MKFINLKAKFKDITKGWREHRRSDVRVVLATACQPLLRGFFPSSFLSRGCDSINRLDLSQSAHRGRPRSKLVSQSVSQKGEERRGDEESAAATRFLPKDSASAGRSG